MYASTRLTDRGPLWPAAPASITHHHQGLRLGYLRLPIYCFESFITSWISRIILDYKPSRPMATGSSSKFPTKASNSQAQPSASQKAPSASRPSLTAEERRLASERRLRLIEEALAETAAASPPPATITTVSTTPLNYRIEVIDGPFPPSSVSFTSAASSSRLDKSKQTPKSSGTNENLALTDSFANMTLSTDPAAKSKHSSNEKDHRKHQSVQSHRMSGTTSLSSHQRKSSSSMSAPVLKLSKTIQACVPPSPSKAPAIQPRAPVTALSREQTRILKLVQSGESVFYTGSAG